jgi:hypothetical protein
MSALTLQTTGSHRSRVCVQFLAVDILEKLISTRWRILPEDQRNGACEGTIYIAGRC